MWDVVIDEVKGDLHELVSHADPGVVKEVIRQHHCEMLTTQTLGLVASLSAAHGYEPGQAGEAAKHIARKIELYASENTSALAQKIEKANERYIYLIAST